MNGHEFRAEISLQPAIFLCGIPVRGRASVKVLQQFFLGLAVSPQSVRPLRETAHRLPEPGLGLVSSAVAVNSVLQELIWDALVCKLEGSVVSGGISEKVQGRLRRSEPNAKSSLFRNRADAECEGVRKRARIQLALGENFWANSFSRIIGLARPVHP